MGEGLGKGFRVIDRIVVHNHSFKILKRLLAQTLIDSQQQLCMISWCKYRYQHVFVFVLIIVSVNVIVHIIVSSSKPPEYRTIKFIIIIFLIILKSLVNPLCGCMT